jgi:hypothetical protein
MMRTSFAKEQLPSLGFAQAHRWGGLLFPAGFAFLGDPECGPVLRVMAMPPGVSTDGEDGKSAPPHGHASDNFRIALRGVLKMGQRRYGPGEFRLQQGWKPYGSDTVAEGPDGGWEMLMFADRRGMRMRPVRSRPGDPVPYLDVEKSVAEWMDYRSDWFGDDPGATCPASRLASTLGTPAGGGISGSFADTRNWRRAGEESRVSVTLMGDATAGPVVATACTGPNVCAAGPAEIPTETFRLIVGGECTIGGVARGIGDMSVVPSGASAGRVVAGDRGLHEVVVYGDRRELGSLAAADGWPRDVPEIVGQLLAETAQPNR